MTGARIPFYLLWPALGASMLVRTFYTFQKGAISAAGTAAPWAVVLAGGVAVLAFWPVAAALARRPGSNLIGLALEIGGRPLAVGVAVGLGALLVGGTGLGIRQASELAVTGFYPHTPQTFIMVSLMLAGALGAALTPPEMVWMGAISAVPTLLSLLLVLVGTVAWGQFRLILPATGPGLLPVAAEIIPLTSYSGELIYLAVISNWVAAPGSLFKAALWGSVLATLTSAAMLLVYLMVFPLPGGAAFPFPLMEMTRLVQGGRFLERIDMLFIWLWAIGSCGLAAGALQSAALLLKDAFRLPTHRGAVLPLAVATIAAALVPSNQAGAIDAEIFLVRRWGFVLTLLLPLLISLGALVRGRKYHA